MFLYFLPTTSPTITPADLPPELRYAFDAPPKQAGCHSGPGGSAGMILANSLPTGRFGYFPASQTWQQIPGSKCFVGCETSLLTPTAAASLPQTLERPQLLPGKLVSDSLGHGWQVPFATNYVEFEQEIWPVTHLPQRLSLQPNGCWIRGAVLPKYERLWELVQAYSQAIAEATIAAAAEEEEVIRFSFPEVDELALTALAVNYRLGAVECELLGIYDETFRQSIIEVARGLPLFAALKKKRDQLGGDSLPPAADSMPDSPPPSPPASGNSTAKETTTSPT